MTLPTRAGVPALALGLAASALALLPTSSASAAGLDPTPPAQASTWLKGQLIGNVVVDPTTPVSTDFEASLDAATGFAVLGDTATATSILGALEPQIDTYVGIAPASVANPLARTAFTVKQLGGDPTKYGGADRVAQLQTLVTTTASATAEVGQLTNGTGVTTPAPDVTGQAYAAGVLPADANVTTYLLKQQCNDGFFSAGFAATTFTCQSTVPLPTPSVEATASAVVALTARAADPVVKPAYDRAVAWLVKTQQSNGRWTANGGEGAGDAALTGLAGYAVGLAGRTGAAGQAAVWLRGQQLANAGTCPGYPAPDLGAVAADPASYDTAPTTAISTSAARQKSFREATAGALAGLKATPAGDFGTASQIALPRFSKPGKVVTATVRSAARNTLCASAPGLAATKLVVAYNGTATYNLTTAADGPLTTTVVDAAGQTSSATVTSLGKKKLGFSFKSKKVRSGKVAVVKVRGLAPGENVKVQFRGKRKDTAVASSSGEAKLRFIVTGKRGFVKVRVAGEYSNRNRTKNLVVVR